MALQADVITAAIESLDVQVSWAGVHVVGVADPTQVDPLFAAFAEYGGPEQALAAFTREVFCYGNVAVICAHGQAKAWPPWWRLDSNYAPHVSKGHLIEARNPPLVAGFGTPVVEPALAAFKAYWAQWGASIGALQAYVLNPVGPSPTGGMQAIDAARAAVFAAMGFQSHAGGFPQYLPAAKLRADVKALFESQILRPFATHMGIAGNPSLAP